MKELIKDIISLLEHKESFALATIIKQRGSAPRDSGTHMVICQDGNILGTIGGGLMEALVRDHAEHVIRERIAHIFELNLTCNQLAQTDMICGGKVEILIDFIDAHKEGSMEIYREIYKSIKSSQQIWLITMLIKDQPHYRTQQCIFKADGKLTGSVDFPGRIDSLLPQIQNIREFTFLNNNNFIIEPMGVSEIAYIFGGGHIAKKLVPLLNMVDFLTVVIDDRAEYANSERFPVADRFIARDFDGVVKELDINEQSYIVIVTRGHMHDKIVLAQVLQTKAAYIGMIGSMGKRNTIFSSLLNEGFTETDLARVYSPIGLKIGADSPEEIAVSIAAELIKIRSDRYHK